MRRLAGLALAAAWVATRGAAAGFHGFAVPPLSSAEELKQISSLLRRADAVADADANAGAQLVVHVAEDEAMEVALPANCGRIFWRSLAGGHWTADDGAPVQSGSSLLPPRDAGDAALPPNTLPAGRCNLIFTPEADFTGELQFWYTTVRPPLQPGDAPPTAPVSSVVESLHSGLLVVAPRRDAPAAVDDSLGVVAPTWALLAVLANDADRDIVSADMTHACLRSNPVVTRGASGSTASGAASAAATPGVWLDVVAIADVPSTNVTVIVAPEAASDSGYAAAKRPCPFHSPIVTSLPPAPLPRCVASFTLKPRGGSASAAAAAAPPTHARIDIIVAPMDTGFGAAGPVTHILHHVPLSSTLFLRHSPNGMLSHVDAPAPPTHDGDPAGSPSRSDGYPSHSPRGLRVHHANASLPICDVLRIAAVTEPLHGHAVALPPPDIKHFPCFLVGGPLTDEALRFMVRNRDTGAIEMPPISDQERATLEALCNGPWQMGLHTPSSLYSLPGDISSTPIPTLIAYHPDPGYTGADVFTYDVGDSGPGIGVNATGTVIVRIAAPGSSLADASAAAQAALARIQPHAAAATGTGEAAAPEGRPMSAYSPEAVQGHNHAYAVSAADCLRSWRCALQTFDGRFNSLAHIDEGSMMTPLRRVAPPAYADGIDAPAGADRPSTRIISNELFAQSGPIPSSQRLAELHVHFGQFLTHDLDFATPLADFKSESNYVIPIPTGDPWFDPEGTGNATMRFRRTGPQVGTGAGTGFPRQQLNKVTAHLDLNVIYGTLNPRNKALRAGSAGKLAHLAGTNSSALASASAPVGGGTTTAGGTPACGGSDSDSCSAPSARGTGVSSCQRPMAAPSMPLPVDTGDAGDGGDSDAAPMQAARAADKERHPPQHQRCFALQVVEAEAGNCTAPGASPPCQRAIAQHKLCRPVRPGALEHLALNTAHLPNLNLLGRPRAALFVSGDNRVNVQPGLAAMHTLLAREHNAVADEIMAAMLLHHRSGGDAAAAEAAVASDEALAAARAPHRFAWHTPALPPLPIDVPMILELPGLSARISGVPYPVPITWPRAFDGSAAALRHYDEALFQTARAITRAKWQAIVWYEWLPLVLGPQQYALLPPLNLTRMAARAAMPTAAALGTIPEDGAPVSNEFATAAFRFGHSQVGSAMHRYDAESGCATEAGAISLRDAYFTAMRLLGEGGVDPIIAGSLLHVAEEVDTRAVDEVRNLLFATNTQGFDLIALNIQRGRDHGLPHYNAVRSAMGLPRLRRFADISPDARIVATLRRLYSGGATATDGEGDAGIDDVDLLVGGLAEPHVPGGAVGPTFAALIRDVFTRVRDGDRFWFEAPTSSQHQLLTAIAPLDVWRRTRIADLLARDTSVLDGRLGLEVAAWHRGHGPAAALGDDWLAAPWQREWQLRRTGDAARSGVVGARSETDGGVAVGVPHDAAHSLFIARDHALAALTHACHRRDGASSVAASEAGGEPDFGADAVAAGTPSVAAVAIAADGSSTHRSQGDGSAWASSGSGGGGAMDDAYGI